MGLQPTMPVNGTSGTPYQNGSRRDATIATSMVVVKPDMRCVPLSVLTTSLSGTLLVAVAGCGGTAP